MAEPHVGLDEITENVGERPNLRHRMVPGEGGEYVARADAPPRTFGGMPVTSLLILVVEFCERFAFYAASLVFMLYCQVMLGYKEGEANALSSAFMFWSYACALLGGFIADACIGKFLTILAFGVVYLVGLIILAFSAMPFSFAAFPDEPTSFATAGFVISLFLIGTGTGGIKSNVSTLVADQMPDASEESVQGVFRAFYWCINAGSLLGIFLSPLLHKFGPLKVYGPHSANSSFYLSFLMPCVVFLFGLILFSAGRRRYIVRRPQGSLLSSCLRMIQAALAARRGRVKNKDHWLDWAKSSFPEQNVDELKSALRASAVFLWFPLYWLLYNQMQSNFISQAEWMDKPTWLTSDQLNVVNPLMLVILLPLFDRVLFPFLRSHYIAPGPIARISFGFVVSGLGFIYVGALQGVLHARGTWDVDDLYILNPGAEGLSIWWQVPPYVFIAISEIFASVTALEFAYSQSPPSLKSIVMSLFLVSNAGGSLMGLLMSPLIVPAYMVYVFFGFSAGILLFAALFWLRHRHFRLRTAALAEQLVGDTGLRDWNADIDDAEARVLARSSELGSISDSD